MALAGFEIEPHHALALIQAPVSGNDIEEIDLEKLSCLIDYGWLCDASRPNTQPELNDTQRDGFASWGIFDRAFDQTQHQSSDFIGDCMNLMMNSSEADRDTGWWYNIGMQN